MQSSKALNTYPTNGTFITESNKHIEAKKNVGKEIVFLPNTKLSNVLSTKQAKTIAIIQTRTFDSRLITSLKSSANEIYVFSL